MAIGTCYDEKKDKRLQCHANGHFTLHKSCGYSDSLNEPREELKRAKQ